MRFDREIADAKDELAKRVEYTVTTGAMTLLALIGAAVAFNSGAIAAGLVVSIIGAISGASTMGFVSLVTKANKHLKKLEKLQAVNEELAQEERNKSINNEQKEEIEKEFTNGEPTLEEIEEANQCKKMEDLVENIESTKNEIKQGSKTIPSIKITETTSDESTVLSESNVVENQTSNTNKSRR